MDHEELKASGVVLADLADTIAQEMNSDAKHTPVDARQSDDNGPDKLREGHCEGCLQRDRLITHLEGQLDELRDDKERLRLERDELRQLALPNPDRRPWWARVLGLNRT